MAITLAVGIVHAPWQAERRAWVIQQRRLLSPLAVFVVPDVDRRGPWGNSERTIRTLLNTSASHLMLLSDDMLPVRSFPQNALAALRRQPEALVTFYTTDPAAARAFNKGCSWLITPGGLEGSALAMPREWFTECLAWQPRHIQPDYRFEDRRIRLWARSTGRLVYATIPSLIDHVGADHSLVRRKGISSHARVLAEPDLLFDWRGQAYAYRGRYDLATQWREVALVTDAPPPWTRGTLPANP